MAILILFLSTAVRAGEVHSFPGRPHAEVRRAVREVLSHRRWWDEEVLVAALRTGPVATAQIVLEEVNASLSRPGRVVPRPRVETTLNALLALPVVAATGPERGALRTSLRPLVAGSTAHARLEPALGLAVHFKVWEPEDVTDMDLSRARRAFLRRWFFLIVASARRLDPAKLDEVARQLLGNEGDPLLRFGLLDEIGRLPTSLDAMLLRLLRFGFEPNQPREVDPEARRIHQHVLARWQDRVRARDPRTLAALARLERESTDAADRAFARRLARDPRRPGCGLKLVEGDSK